MDAIELKYVLTDIIKMLQMEAIGAEDALIRERGRILDCVQNVCVCEIKQSHSKTIRE